jgi:autotransporter-associated beta strand protein
MKIMIQTTAATALVCLLAMTPCGNAQTSINLPQPEKDPAPALPAPPPPAGVPAIVDTYKSQLAAGSPTVPVLSQFLNLYTPGTAWNNGTILNHSVMSYNNQYVVGVTINRDEDQAVAAYMDDRRNQSYSVIDGLGPLTSIYLKGAQSVTTIPNFDATTLYTEYDDAGTGNAGGSLTSPLNQAVALVNNVRSFSTTPDKLAYNYPRPWRVNTSGVVQDTGETQSEEVTDVDGSSTTVSERTWNVYDCAELVDPYLLVVRSQTPASDQGFPSGHTNAAYSAVLAMAYTIPQRYQELLTRASELGSNRIIAGMHSPLDVMGGRMSATAWAAAILYNDDMSNTSSPVITEQGAYTATQDYLYKVTGTNVNTLNTYAHKESIATDRFANWAQNKKNFTERLTYGFSPIGSTIEPVRVPKGAEVLLETRQPYLSGDQRRWELYTTGIQSGYPLLDDAEGWGRLDLFAAADGYGSLEGNVFVAMDSNLGGFNALDLWRNNITGSGKLFKRGSGWLKLAGYNQYSGGTEIDAGVLEADSSTAFGDGDVVVAGGTLADRASAGLSIVGGYNQLAGSVLSVELGAGNAGTLAVSGPAGLDGTLDVSVQPELKLDGDTIVPVITSAQRVGTFSTINVAGTKAKYKVIYTAGGVSLEFNPTN